MNERIKDLRTTLKLTQEDFGSRIGSARNTIANYESGNRKPSNAVIMAICREFNINEDWLRHGTGEMFREFTEDEKVATYVSQLLEDEGDNAFNTIIIEIMRTYNELEPISQEIIKESCRKLIENLSKKKEG